ncbi:MAG: hypothetical protein ACJ72N_24235, partial [Labedaea sp.]
QRAAVRASVQERPAAPEVPDGFADDVRAALYASKVVAYAQGFDLIVAGAREFDWDIDLGVPVTGIAEATFARALSAHPEQRAAARAVLPGPSSAVPLGDRDTFVDDVRKALYASKVVAYAQGYDQMAAASAEYGWQIDLGAMATIWRGGCIIRARFLDRIREAYANAPELPSLLVDPYFADAVAQGQDAWRRIVAHAAQAGIPTPAFSSSLAYEEGLRAERRPAAQIHGLRDYFGAHTYRRVDRDGSFHTMWGADRREVDA